MNGVGLSRGSGSGTAFGDDGVDVEWRVDHFEDVIFVEVPFFFGSVPVKLDTVAVGVIHVNGLANAVVSGAVELVAVCVDAVDGLAEGGASGVDKGDVEETGVARRWGRAVLALPGIEAEVVVIVVKRQEDGLVTVFGNHAHADNLGVEFGGTGDVGDFEVAVADVGAGSSLWLHGVGPSDASLKPI